MIDSLYLDSGAYSVQTQGVYISLEEYEDYINKYGEEFDYCFNLDDKFNDPEHNLKNLLHLKKSAPNVNLVPVLHDKVDPFRELELHIGLGYDYISIGSSNRDRVK